VEPVVASAEHFVPEGQSLYVPSLPSDLTYSASSKLVKWNGQLTPGQVITYVWETNVLSDLIETIYPTITFSIGDWGLKFDRFTPYYGKGPDLSNSVWLTTSDNALHTGSVVTLSLLLQNGSDYPGILRTSVWMMEGVSPVTATLPMTDMPHGWAFPWWTGNLEPYGAHTLTLPLHVWAWEGPVRVDAMLSDESGGRWELPLWLNVMPWSFYLPLITK
jgi:hypothetical protein